MIENRWTRGTVAAAVAAALWASLAGCGGGGGDAGAPPASGPNINVTAANRDRVGHATAAGVLALSPTMSVPLGAYSLSTGRAWTQASGSTQPTLSAARIAGLLRQWLHGAGVRAGGPMSHALAVQGPIVFGCAVAGTMLLTVDDHDDSGDLGAGDVITTTYSDCQDTDSETLNGTVTTTLVQLTPTSLIARLFMSQFSDAAARHALTLDGSMLLDDSQPSSTVEVVRLAADGPVVASVVTHLFTDTVTLHNGFTEEATYDAVFGRSASTVNGYFESVAAGGVVEVSVAGSSPLVQYDVDAYPRSGAVQIKGSKGTLWLTVLSAESVQIDLDADDNGSAESTTLVTWDWLL